MRPRLPCPSLIGRRGGRRSQHARSALRERHSASESGGPRSRLAVHQDHIAPSNSSGTAPNASILEKRDLTRIEAAQGTATYRRRRRAATMVKKYATQMTRRGPVQVAFDEQSVEAVKPQKRRPPPHVPMPALLADPEDEEVLHRPRTLSRR